MYRTARRPRRQVTITVRQSRVSRRARAMRISHVCATIERRSTTTT